MSKKIGFLYPVTTWSLSNSIRLLLCYHTYFYIYYYQYYHYPVASLWSSIVRVTFVVTLRMQFCIRSTMSIGFVPSLRPIGLIVGCLPPPPTIVVVRRLELCGPISLVCVCAFLWMRISYINWWWRSSKASFNR